MNSQNELTSAGSTNEQISVTEEQQYDEAFAALREDIKARFEQGMVGGKRLFRMDEVRFNIDKLMLVTPEALRSYYTCNACTSFLRRFSSMGFMADDGSLNNVVLDALSASEYFSMRIEIAMPNFMAMSKKHLQRVKPVAVPTLNFSFTNSESATLKNEDGVFTHLHGSNEHQRQRYNASNVSSDATNQAAVVWMNMQATFISGEKLIALQARLEKEIHRPEAVGLLTPYAELMDKVKAMKSNQVRFLASLLITREYSWLNQIENKLAANVLEELRDPSITADNISERLTMLVRKLKARTAPGVYKEKVAASSDGLIDNTVKFLKEKGWEDALLRTIPTIEEYPMTWRPGQVTEKAVAAEETPVSALDAAASQLRKNKSATDKAQDLEDGLDGFIKKPAGTTSISLKSFNERLADFAKIELSFAGAPLYPVMVTAPTDGKAYPEMFKYTLCPEANAKGMLAVMNTSPISPRTVEHALAGGYSANPEQFTSIKSGSFYELNGYSEEESTGGRAWLKGISDYFFRNYESYGGMILGTNLAEAHYGMSRGLIDLSRKMKLGYAGVATSNGAGGLAVAVGMLFRCTKFDGTIEMHHIASVE